MIGFMDGFNEPKDEADMQWRIWENYQAHERLWGGMEHDPHDHCNALYNIPYVQEGLRLYQEHILSSAGSILEIGCAQGYILNHVGGPSTKRVGIDFNEDRIRKGRDEYPDTTFIVGDIRHMRIEEQYDYVLLPGILEHMRFQDARELIENAFYACKTGGKVLFDLPWWDGHNFDMGIHQNPAHAWTGTKYRWRWLFRGFDAQRIHLPNHSFYVFGVIDKQEVKDLLVGCWGKIGDIVHAVPTLQKLGGGDLVYSSTFRAIAPMLDLFSGIDNHYVHDGMDWGTPDMGVKDYARVVNCSHTNFRTDPVRGSNILGWWDDGYHAIDFAAAWGGVTLVGSDRYLQFKPGVVSDTFVNEVAFLSNSGDPGMRNIDPKLWPPVEKFVADLGATPVEYSLGENCIGVDRKHYDLGKVMRGIAKSKLLVSVDTMASGIIAQSLGVPIVRLYTGHTRDTGTGPPDRGWTGYRSVDCPASPKDITSLIEELWTWRR